MALGFNTDGIARRTALAVEGAGQRVALHLQRLSSGLRIGAAADDAAGLGRAERLHARQRSQAAAARNARDMIGLVRATEGGLAAMQEIAQRMRVIVLEALDGTTSDTERRALDSEHRGLAEELSRLTASTEFNGLGVLSHSAALRLQLAQDADDAYGVEFLDLTAVGFVLGYYSLEDEDHRLRLQRYTRLLDEGLSRLRGYYGAAENRLASSARSADTAGVAAAAAESRIRDADLAAETAALASERIRQGMGVRLLRRARLQPELALDLLQPTGTTTHDGPASAWSPDRTSPREWLLNPSERETALPPIGGFPLEPQS